MMGTPVRVLIASVLISAAAVVLSPSSALADGDPAPIIETTANAGALLDYVSAPTGEQPGQTAVATLLGTVPAADADPTVADAPIRGRVSDDGRVRYEITLPDDALPGSSYTLAVRTGGFTDSRTITIAAAVPTDVKSTKVADVEADNAYDRTPLIWFGAGVLVFLVALIAVTQFARRAARQNRENQPPLR